MALPMYLPGALAWLVDEAGASPGPDRFLAELGGRLLVDGLPLAGGALTLAVAHPIIARRTWLWRAETGAVIEALGFAASPLSQTPPGQAGRDWLMKLGPVQEETLGSGADSPVLGWAGTRPFSRAEARRLRQAARFAAAPLAVLAARAGMAHLDAVRQAQGLPPLPFGAALHLGEILWGNIGAADRLDFTAIGPAVNLVSRLEGLCRPLGRPVLISGAVAALTTTPLVPLGEHVLRGIVAPCTVFTLPDA